MPHTDLASLVAAIRAGTLTDPRAGAAAQALEAAAAALRRLKVSGGVTLAGAQIGSWAAIRTDHEPPSGHLAMTLARVRADLAAAAPKSADGPTPLLGPSGLDEVTIALSFNGSRANFRYVQFDGRRIVTTKPRLAASIAAAAALAAAGIERPTVPYTPPTAPHPNFFVNYSVNGHDHIAPVQTTDLAAAIRDALWYPTMEHLVAGKARPVLNPLMLARDDTREALATLGAAGDTTSRLVALFARPAPEAA